MDGDGKRRADLLIQAKPSFVMIDFDPAFPVPAHAPNMNGIVLAGTGSSIFSLAGVHAWSRRDYGADWSPLTSTLVIGDFNGDGRDDVLIQPRSAVQPAKLATGSGSGNPITSATTLADNVSWAASSYRLIAGNFDGGEGAGVYFQATAPAGTNSIADVVTSAFITLSAHNPSATSGTLPVSAVGRTSGSFRVSNDGAATYTIPIVVPPGVMGIQPELSIAYDSSKSGGAIGLGWNLLGFSRITRCGKTIDQDGTVSAVELSMNDRFCLDGNKLRLTEGAYGAAGSKYRTEFETFAVITAVGTAGSGPASFTMVAKNGTTYEYGATANFRIESIKPASSTTPHTWAVNKIKDVHGNYMTFTYQEDGAPNGSFRPISITYTSNDAVPLTAAYSVNFIWDPRPEFDLSEAYVGGGRIRDTFRLARIETRYGGSLVRSYRVWHYSERPSS